MCVCVCVSVCVSVSVSVCVCECVSVCVWKREREGAREKGGGGGGDLAEEGCLELAALEESFGKKTPISPHWRQPRGKSSVNLPQTLPPGGSI